MSIVKEIDKISGTDTRSHNIKEAVKKLGNVKSDRNIETVLRELNGQIGPKSSLNYNMDTDILQGGFYTHVKKVELGTDIKRLGSGAFGGYSAMEILDAPGLIEISSGSFGGNNALREIKIPNVEILGNGVFYGLTGLTDVNLPSIKEIQASAFSNCSGLSHIHLGPNTTTINSSAFASIPNNVVIDCDFAEDAISGAPWGAPSTTVFNYVDLETDPILKPIPVKWRPVYKSIMDGTYADKYPIGSKIPLKYHSSGGYNYTVDMEVVGIDADECADGSISHLSFLSVPVVESSCWTKAETNVGGYETSDCRKKVELFLNGISSGLTDIIKTVKKKHTAVAQDESVYLQELYLKVWAPSRTELFGENSDYAQPEGTIHYTISEISKWYPNATHSSKYVQTYFTRSSTATNAHYVNGNASNPDQSLYKSDFANTSGSVAVGFCL